MRAHTPPRTPAHVPTNKNKEVAQKTGFDLCKRDTGFMKYLSRWYK